MLGDIFSSIESSEIWLLLTQIGGDATNISLKHIPGMGFSRFQNKIKNNKQLSENLHA